jgi:hypothetical protein
MQPQLQPESNAVSVLTLPPFESPSVDVEAACIDLLCRLESLVCAIKQGDPADRNEIAVETAQRMMVEMVDFAVGFLGSDANHRLDKEISLAFEATIELDELNRSRSIKDLLRRALGREHPNAVRLDVAFANLIESLNRSMVTLSFHAIELVGVDTTVGKQLNEGTLLLVEELEAV